MVAEVKASLQIASETGRRSGGAWTEERWRHLDGGGAAAPGADAEKEVVGAVPRHRSDINWRARADPRPDSRPESAAEARFEG